MVCHRNHVFPIASEAGKRTEAISSIRLEDEAKVVGGEGRQSASATGGGEADGGDVLIPTEVVLRQFSGQLDFLRRGEGKNAGRVAARVGRPRHGAGGVHERNEVVAVGDAREERISDLLPGEDGVRSSQLPQRVFDRAVEGLGRVVGQDFHRGRFPEAVNLLHHAELRIHHRNTQVRHLDEAIRALGEHVHSDLEGDADPEVEALTGRDLPDEGSVAFDLIVDGIRIGHHKGTLSDLIGTHVEVRGEGARSLENRCARNLNRNVGRPPGVVGEFGCDAEETAIDGRGVVVPIGHEQ